MRVDKVDKVVWFFYFGVENVESSSWGLRYGEEYLLIVFENNFFIFDIVIVFV